MSDSMRVVKQRIFNTYREQVKKGLEELKCQIGNSEAV